MVMEKEKKVHWLSTPEGKKRMSLIQKKRWREKYLERHAARTSKAETVVKKTVGKKAGTNRTAIYSRAVTAAIESEEVDVLMRMLGNAVLLEVMK
jgi:hypothetical protein